VPPEPVGPVRDLPFGQHSVVVNRSLIQRFVGESLADNAFARAGRSSVWRRETEQLVHLVRLEVSRGAALIQWGVMSEVLIDSLWCESPDKALWDVGYSAMTGWLSGIPGTALPVAVPIAEQVGEAESTLHALSDDVSIAAAWLAGFVRRSDLVSFLMAVDAPKDRRGFLIPTNLPLKLTTCAFLLAADNSASAMAMAKRALNELRPLIDEKDRLGQHRRSRLSEIARR
jgi:hypothetical protein